MSLSAGRYHSLILGVDEQVYSFGKKEFGEIGRITSEPSKPGVIDQFGGLETPPNIIQVSAGSHHSLLLDQDGVVWSCGSNRIGELGRSPSPNQHIPMHIALFVKIKLVSVGRFHSLILDEHGIVFAFGSDKYGQLGLDLAVDYVDNPRFINGLNPIKSISAGFRHSLFLGEKGNVYSCGDNTRHQLGRPKRDLPTEYVNYNPFPVIISRGDVNSPIIAISAGKFDNLLLDEHGRAYSFGLNNHGQLGVDDKEFRESATRVFGLPTLRGISVGSAHSLFLDIEGFIYSCGQNNQGRLGFFSNEDVLVPTLIPEFEDFLTLPTIVEISAGSLHNLLLDSEGFVYYFGSRNLGRIDIATPRNYTQIIPKPLLIPGILGQVMARSLSFIKTIYPIIEKIWPQVVDFRIRADLEEENLLEFDTSDGTVYLAQATYDFSTDEVYPPAVYDNYFDTLEYFISLDLLDGYSFRPDLYSDDQDNQGFEFKDSEGQRYLTIVYRNEGRIFPPRF